MDATDLPCSRQIDLMNGKEKARRMAGLRYSRREYVQLMASDAMPWTSFSSSSILVASPLSPVTDSLW